MQAGSLHYFIKCSFLAPMQAGSLHYFIKFSFLTGKD
jgi:hypothetical protein